MSPGSPHWRAATIWSKALDAADRVAFECDEVQSVIVEDGGGYPLIVIGVSAAFMVLHPFQCGDLKRQVEDALAEWSGQVKFTPVGLF